MKWLWLGVATGGPILGWLSHRLQSCRIPMLYASTAGEHCVAGLWCASQFAVCECGIVCFWLFLCWPVPDFRPGSSIGMQTQLLGTIGLNNMAVIMGGTVLQPLAGWILDLHRSGVNHTIPYYFP